LEKRLAKIATANLEELKLKARHVYTGSDGAESDIGIAKSRLRPSRAQRQAGLEGVMAQKNDMTIRLRYLTWKPRALCWVLRRPLVEPFSAPTPGNLQAASYSRNCDGWRECCNFLMV
jgi:hypothetical protein